MGKNPKISSEKSKILPSLRSRHVFRAPRRILHLKITMFSAFQSPDSLAHFFCIPVFEKGCSLLYKRAKEQP